MRRFPSRPFLDPWNYPSSIKSFSVHQAQAGLPSSFASLGPCCFFGGGFIMYVLEVTIQYAHNLMGGAQHEIDENVVGACSNHPMG